LAELVRVAPGLLEAHLPGIGGVDARTRERLILTVAETTGCGLLQWVHGAWQEFLGPTQPDEDCEPLLAFARASAEAGVPLDATILEAVYPAAVVRSTRATVARAEVGSFLASSAALPVLWPTAALAGVLRLATRVAPPVPEPELPSPDETNLVVHMLAEALPNYLGHAVVRSVLLWNPLVLAIGVRVEGIAATLRIGQGRVRLVGGIDRDALVVVDGGLEPLLTAAAGSIVRQLVP
jgi:hypothetical protein